MSSESPDDHGGANKTATRFGAKIFPWRFGIGLGISLIGIEILKPVPLFGSHQWLAQIMSVLLILAGLALRAWGSGCAGDHTRSDSIEAFRLATGGPFAYLRNPIYAGSILVGLGMVLLIGDPWALFLAGIAFAILYFLIVPAEEAFLRKQFGHEYLRYCEAVPRLWPRLQPWPARVERAFQWRCVRGELPIVLLLPGIYFGLMLEERFDASPLHAWPFRERSLIEHVQSTLGVHTSGQQGEPAR